MAGRAVQGAAGAVFPLAFGIIRDEFPRERVATGIGLISATFGIGGGAGPGAQRTDRRPPLLRVDLLVRLGVVLVAIVATHLFVPESPVKSPARIDWVGRRAAVRRARLACCSRSARATAGAGARPRIVGLFAAAAVSSPPGCASSSASASRSSTSSCCGLRGVWTDEPDRLPDRLRHVRLVHPDPAVRADARRPPATASRRRHRGRAVHAAVGGGHARRRAARRLARRTRRLEVPAAARHRLRGARASRCWRSRTPRSGRSSSRSRCSGSASGSRSRRWRT